MCIKGLVEMADSLAAKLMEKSKLTEAQQDTMVLRKLVIQGAMTTQEARRRRVPKPVSVGAYHRVLDQARSNLEGSIYSVLLAARMGVLGTQEFDRLLNVIASAPLDIDADRAAQVMSVIDALIRNIVML